MIIRVNNIELNEYELLHIINSGKKLNAIKLVKTKTRLSLKECKDIVDNLSDNPNFYDDNVYMPKTDYSKTFHKAKTPRENSAPNNTKNYIILLLLFFIIVLMYLYINKR